MTGLIGRVLLWIGFLGGAYASVCRVERTEEPWTTIPWGWYVGCLAVGTVGVVAVRRDRSQSRSLSAMSETSLESVHESLETVRGRVAELEAGLDGATCEEVLTSIDDRCVPVLAEFADGRGVIQNRFGTAAYADVMTEFASGERYLNRAWSAAADGYVDEVVHSIHASRLFLDAACIRLDAAMSGSATSGSATAE